MGDLGSQEVQGLVEIVMLARMSRELDLDDEQTILLVRRFEETKEQMTNLTKQRAEALDELRASVRDEEAENVIETKLERLIAVDRDLAEVKLKAFDEVGEGFTVTQRAKLYVFVQEFESEMRRLVDRARKRTRGMGPPDGMEMPDDMRQEFKDRMRQRWGGYGGQGGGRPNQPGAGGAPGYAGPTDSPPPPPPENE
jgi:hypothetical protein